MLKGQGSCGLTITTPSDITICEIGSVNLNGSILGNYRSFNWSGSNGFYNDIDLNPFVFITQTTTFKLKAFGEPTTNLIVNGGFESGNTGFTSDYLYVPDIPGSTTELWPEGTYSITSNPNFVHTYFANCTDHSGGGNMMVVNGAPTLSHVWCQTISVNPNTTYIFQAFAASVEPASPAILQFSVNGALLGSPFNLSSQTCRWDEFFETWNSGASTTAVICVTNQNLDFGGNDFAIDDIFFGPLCEEEEEFTVTLDEFVLAPPIPQYLNCIIPEVTLTAIPLPNTKNYSYEWYTTNGSITSNPNFAEITVNAAGSYFVTVTDDNGCTATELYDVYADFDKPIISIDGDTTLNCTRQSTVLTVQSSNNIHNIIWTLPDLSQNNSRTVTADLTGKYTVEVTGDNGCTNFTNVDVVFEKSQFDYLVDSSGPLTCSVLHSDIYLDILSNIDSIRWHNTDILYQNQQKDTITIDKPGTYIFELFLGSDCSLKDSIIIDVLPLLIDYQVPDPYTITCFEPFVQITPDSIAEVQRIVWNLPDTAPEQKDTLTVSKGGYYHFTLFDINGCTKHDSILVIENNELPTLNVSITPITCDNTQGTLDINTSIPASVSWIGTNGESGTEAQITSTSGGTYTVMAVTDAGCIAEEVYEIPLDTIHPQLMTIPDFMLTCTNEVYTPALSYGTFEHYLWQGVGLDAATPLEVTIDKPGTYSLTLSNANGCSIQQSFVVTENKKVPSFTIASENLSCKNPETPLIISGDPLSYLILNNDTISQQYSINTPGVYVFTGVNEFGCSNGFSLTVNGSFNIPQIALDPIELNCYHPEIWLKNSLSNDNLTLSWETPNGTLNQDSILISSTFETVTLTAINEDGCTATVTTMITSDFNLPELNIDGSNVIKCTQDVITLIGSASTQLRYLWTDVSGSPLSITSQLNVSTPGEYTLYGLNESNGCENNLSISVTKEPTPDQVLFSETQPVCFGEMGQFVWIDGIGGTAPYSLTINNNTVKNNETINLSSGIYYIILSDANECILRDTFTIDQVFDFGVDAGRDTSIRLGTSFILNPSTTLTLQEISDIIWEPATSLSCSNCFNPIATPAHDTRYTITIFDADGCVRQDHVTVRVHFVKGYIAPNIFNPNSKSGNNRFTIFPIEQSIRIIKNLSIYDRWGNLVFTIDDIEAANLDQGWDGKFVGRDVQPGVYVWKASLEYKDDTIETVVGDVTVIR